LKEFDPELKSKIKVNSNQYEEYETNVIKEKENKLIVQTIGIREYSWIKKYNDLKNYLKNNQFPTESHKIYGCWIGKQRQNKKNNKLSNEKIKLLEELKGWFWFWDLDEQWMEKYNSLKEYLKNNNELTKQSNKIYGGWISTQRQNKKNSKLSNERIKLLEELKDWIWEIDYDNQWMEKYNELKEYLKNNDLPKNSNKEFGGWINTQRQYKKKGKLSNEKIKLLEELKDWIWEVDFEKQWIEKYNTLKEYLKNNDLPTSQNKIYGCWISEQRINNKKGKLSNEKIKLLEELNGWFWGQDEEWMKKYTDLKEYLKNNQFPFESNKIYGSWINRQRQNKKNNKLSNEKIKLLEELNGWFWFLDLDEQWMEKYNELKEYLKNNDLPTSQNKIYGCWISTQRTNKKNNKLSNEKIKLLEELNEWFWEVDYDNQWMEKYNELKDYFKNNNKLPYTSNKIYGHWIDKQRQNKKNGKLSDEKIKLLEELNGWFWERKKKVLD
jgi:hypothetical protein